MRLFYIYVSDFEKCTIAFKLIGPLCHNHHLLFLKKADINCEHSSANIPPMICVFG